MNRSGGIERLRAEPQPQPHHQTEVDRVIMSEDLDPSSKPARPRPPTELLSRAELRGNIHWWPPDAAFAAIDWYRDAGVAVIGADLAFLLDGATQATTEVFDASPRAALPTDWPAYVEDCAAQARAFVDAHRTAARSRAVTCLRRSPSVATSTSCRGSSTTGAARTPSASSPAVGRRCARTGPCWSSRRSCRPATRRHRARSRMSRLIVHP